MQILSQNASTGTPVSKCFKFTFIQRVAFLIVGPYLRREFRCNLKFSIACYSSKQQGWFSPLNSPLSHAAQLEFPLHCANAEHGHRTLQESRSQHLSFLSSSNALTSTLRVSEQYIVTANTVKSNSFSNSRQLRELKSE